MPQTAVVPGEKIPVSVYPSSEDASRDVAGEIAALIRANDSQGRKTVLGLATGSTPTSVYNELIRMYQSEKLSFRNVLTFNLDEYWPMQPTELQSYRRFMHECLFDHIDIPRESIHIPDGTVPREKVTEFCRAYEQRIAEAGGIDFQLLGVGRTGHIGFNEPGSPRDSRTRLITLDKVTRMDAAADFFGERHVPRQALTMGVGTILAAKRIVLVAFGEHKAAVLRRAIEGEVSPNVAASYLQQHPNARMVLDSAAAADLTRFKTPWVLGPISDFGQEWTGRLIRRAVIWLAFKLEKPILTLTTEDYNEHGLQDLLAVGGSAYDLNIEVFKALQRTITGWPGGKPAPTNKRAQALKGSEAWISAVDPDMPSIFPKRVLVFSPHPDDDVISMGGTLIRLCQQGHDVHTAYQTSGNIAVFDEVALWHADLIAEFCKVFNIGQESAQRIESAIEQFVRGKKAGEVDSAELQQLKTLIRRTEAVAAARFAGVSAKNIHFLDMPFYETGRVRKKPLGEDDIRIIVELLEKVRPHQVYAAGDLSDPHGTHRVCLSAILKALERVQDRPWMRECQVWLYRGAWQEWGVDEIEMAVPLSPDEVLRKRMAIFRHESQKDKALFPGIDDREFWQRAEHRNKNTALLYDKLGLAEYEALEGFVRWRGQEMR